MAEFCQLVEKGHVWEESGVMTQAKKEVEVGSLLLVNDKNNVIDNKVLSYFQCLSSKFEVYIAHFRTK